MSLPKRSGNASGSQKRKKKTKKDEFIASQSGSILKFLQAQPSNSDQVPESDDEKDQLVIQHPKSPSESGGNTQVDVPEDEISTMDRQLQISEESSRDIPTTEDCGPLETDPSFWPDHISNFLRNQLVEIGPMRHENMTYPYNNSNRRFSKTYFEGVKPNGEPVDRRWLVYSRTLDSVFCFCCKIFGTTKIQFASEGFSDWKNASVRLSQHEASNAHKTNLLAWLEFEQRLRIGKCLDQDVQQQLHLETHRWKDVLQRLLSITKFLASHNLAFRGSSDKLYTPSNGNFLGLVELIAEFDPVMKEHVRKAISHKIKDHYLSKSIQNELINLAAAAVKENIISACKKAKYFSIISDCTRDLSRVEQMTTTIRFVSITDGSVKIEEHFIGFTIAESSTGEALAENILKQIKDSGLNIDDCRGQGYDNGANMKGMRQGVQKRILDINPRAFFVPCCCHSLNLVVKDAAESNLITVGLFAFIQKLYTFCSASPQRWATLIKHAPTFTLKSLSTTRWQARVDSLKAIRYQTAQIYDGLQELASTLDDSCDKYEALCLGNHLKEFPFLVSLVVWYDVLFMVSLVSKKLQNIEYELDSALSEIVSVIQKLKQYRETGFAEALATARELAEELDVSPNFPPPTTLRVRRKKQQFDYECPDEPILDPKDKFEVEFFNVLVDQTLSSLTQRFEQVNAHNDTFGFLYDISKIANMTRDLVFKHCQDLELALQGTETGGNLKPKSDISALELCDELQMLSSLVPAKSSALKSLEYICKNRYEEFYVNTVIALRILLTLPVTVASGERDFSRLKLIKTYLRTTMTQDRLSALAQLSIENEICSVIDFDKIISDFANAKARMSYLNKI